MTEALSEDELFVLDTIVDQRGSDEYDWMPWMNERLWGVLESLIERGYVREFFSDPETEVYLTPKGRAALDAQGGTE